ncbi:MAG: RNA repair domain-containing protein [Thermoplasmatota archaeon]
MNTIALKRKKISNNLRTILNEIKWTKDIDKLEIYYRHRGAPDNTRKINGDAIVSIDTASLDTKQSTIPYHRIHTIIYDNEIIFKRKTKTY